MWASKHDTLVDNFSFSVSSSIFAIDTLCTLSGGKTNKKRVITNIPGIIYAATGTIDYSSTTGPRTYSSLRTTWPKQYLYVYTTRYIHTRRSIRSKKTNMTADFGGSRIFYYVQPQHRQQAAARAWCMSCIGPCRQLRAAGTRRYVLLTAVLSDHTASSKQRHALCMVLAVKKIARTYENDIRPHAETPGNALIRSRRKKKKG